MLKAHGSMTEYFIYESPAGFLKIVVEDEMLCGCSWMQDEEVRQNELSNLKSGDIAGWLDAYFAGRELPEFPPMTLKGTEFSLSVWHELMHIPLSATISYQELAERCGRPRAVRAVANAVGRNPLMLFIPCHRIIGSDGKLHGYAGGVERKKWLLDFEAPLSPQ